MERKYSTIQKIVLIGLFAAMTCIATMAITIPIGTSGGYINFGDSIIFIVSIILGPLYGSLCGGIGATIADLVVAPVYAIFTLIVKTIEGFLCGFIYHKLKKKNFFTRFLGMFIAMLFMVFGYFVTELILTGFSGALATLIPNLFQGVVSLIVGLLIVEILRKTHLIKHE